LENASGLPNLEEEKLLNDTLNTPKTKNDLAKHFLLKPTAT